MNSEKIYFICNLVFNDGCRSVRLGRSTNSTWRMKVLFRCYVYAMNMSVAHIFSLCESLGIDGIWYDWLRPINCVNGHIAIEFNFYFFAMRDTITINVLFIATIPQLVSLSIYVWYYCLKFLFFCFMFWMK